MVDMSNSKLAVVILNWNGIKDTEKCIDSLLGQSVDVDIIVVDNGSKDNSVEIIERRYGEKVTILKQAKNLGVAGGMNVGAKYALNNNYRYFALLNNDAVADKDWAEGLINETKNAQVGIATSLLLNATGEKIDTTGEQYSIWGLPFPRGRNQKTEKAPASELVFGATGGASLYKTEVISDIGLFDEDLSAYYEDTDMCFRAQMAGWKIAYTNKAIAYHKQGESSKKIPGFTIYQNFKNLPLVLLKNVPISLLIQVGIRFYFAYALMFFNAIAKGRGKFAIKGAFMSFILGFKKLGERWGIQKRKRVSTKYIKSMLWKDLPPDQTGLRKLRKFFTGKG